MSIKDNIDRIKEEIEKYKICKDVTLLGVSKHVSSDKIREAYNAGIRDFGESYIQEALVKIEELKDLHIRWHFIGHFQANKAGKLADKFYMIQSVDSIKHAARLNDKAKEFNKKINVLLQIDFTDKDTRAGFREFNLQIFKEISILENIKLMGLMTIVPYFSEAEMTRPYFKKIKEIGEELKNLYSLEYLSMGMTDDFKIALSEGANLIRIGSGIFGPRTY